MARSAWAYWLGGCVAFLILTARRVRGSAWKEPERVCSFEVLHLVPRGDVIGHVCGSEPCVCGPTVQLRLVHGAFCWVAIHHALAFEACPEA